MQVNNTDQQSFGMRLKPLNLLTKSKIASSDKTLKHYNQACRLLNKFDPDVDTYIRMTESTNIYGPRTCTIELLIPFKDRLGKLKQIYHKYDKGDLPVRKGRAINFVLSDSEFPYRLEKEALILAEKYHSIVK